MSQADNQPVNQSVSRFSQSVSESISQSVSQLVRQSVNQSVSYSVSRTVSQSVSHFLSSVISPLSYSSHPQANHCTKHHDPEIICRKCTQYSASKNHHSTSKDFLDKAKHIDLIDNRSIWCNTEESIQLQGQFSRMIFAPWLRRINQRNVPFISVPQSDFFYSYKDL